MRRPLGMFSDFIAEDMAGLLEQPQDTIANQSDRVVNAIDDALVDRTWHFPRPEARWL